MRLRIADRTRGRTGRIAFVAVAGARGRALRAIVLGVLALAFRTATAGAQWGVWEADSLLAAGQLAQAESMYYAASSANPRDPAARAALGRYLAARGALRIGAVLLEEARLFGGDTAAIARALTPIYGGLGDFRALASLPRSPLSAAERARARWLVANPETIEIADSASTVSYQPTGEATGVGVVALRVGDRRVDAVVDPRISGLLLDGGARWKKALRGFGADSAGTVAVAPELGLGDVTFANVPARIDSTAQLTRLGLDVLRRLAPTFDAPSRTLTLRRSGQIAAATPGTRIPVLIDDTGMRLLRDGHWESASGRAAGVLLSTTRWTLDPRRGEIVVAP